MATDPQHPIQRKKPAKRAFTGLAGSPLAEILVDAAQVNEIQPQETAHLVARRGSFPVGPSLCPNCGRRKLFETRRQDGTVQAECLSDATPVCGYLMVYGRRAEMRPQPKRPGRPTKHGRAMSSAERKIAERNKPLIEKLVAEQKTDRATGGRGAGMLLTDAHESTVAKLVSVHDIETVSDAADSNIPGIRHVNPKGSGADDAHDANDEIQHYDESKETAKTFQHMQRFAIRKKWSYDDRDKEELARSLAPGFIEILDPRTCLRWDQEIEEFVEWEGYVCKICLRVFAFESFAVRHIIDRVTEECGARSKPHRRIVLKNIGRLQPGAGLKIVS